MAPHKVASVAVENRQIKSIEFQTMMADIKWLGSSRIIFISSFQFIYNNQAFSKSAI
jgi:hypothetical protein